MKVYAAPVSYTHLEEKLHLVEKFLNIKEKVHRINEVLKEDAKDTEALVRSIEKISTEILEEL